MLVAEIEASALSSQAVDDIVQRVWDNLIGRGSGPMNFRVIVQPLVATIIAVRAGLKDAREGRPAFFWTVLTDERSRQELLHEGWKDIGKVFIVATILDSIYQLRVHHAVHVLELLITATVLAIIPYLLIRGPVNRIARRKPIEKIEKQVIRKKAS